MNRSISLAAVVLILSVVETAHGQSPPLQDAGPRSSFLGQQSLGSYFPADTTDPSPNLPDPKSVMYKSLMIPGWGQIVNKQAWKVPIVYALLGGLAGYSIFLTKRYHDYRAAYYNLNPQIEEDDMRFGPTPDYISPDASLSFLRETRNYYHNRRDFIYITIALAYGLNAIDAYVFAHLRSFDVSDDLSMRPTVKPDILARSTPGVTLSLELFK